MVDYEKKYYAMCERYQAERDKRMNDMDQYKEDIDQWKRILRDFAKVEEPILKEMLRRLSNEEPEIPDAIMIRTISNMLMTIGIIKLH